MKQNDKVSYKTRLHLIHWNEVAFKNHTALDCEERFRKLSKNVRQFRNLEEIVIDVEASIEANSEKTMTGFEVFVRDYLDNTQSCDFVSVNHSDQINQRYTLHIFQNETYLSLPTLYEKLPPEKQAFYTQKAKEAKITYDLKTQFRRNFF